MSTYCQLAPYEQMLLKCWSTHTHTHIFCQENAPENVLYKMLVHVITCWGPNRRSVSKMCGSPRPFVTRQRSNEDCIRKTKHLCFLCLHNTHYGMVQRIHIRPSDWWWISVTFKWPTPFFHGQSFVGYFNKLKTGLGASSILLYLIRSRFISNQRCYIAGSSPGPVIVTRWTTDRQVVWSHGLNLFREQSPRIHGFRESPALHKGVPIPLFHFGSLVLTSDFNHNFSIWYH